MPKKQVSWLLAVLVALSTFYLPFELWAQGGQGVQAEQAEHLTHGELGPDVHLNTETEIMAVFAALSAVEGAAEDFEAEIKEESGGIAEIALKSSQPLLNEQTRDLFVLTERDLPRYQQVMEVEATAYTHTGNPTFTGVYPRIGTIAVDPSVFPLGTRMYVEGYGFGIAEDTGGLIKGEIIDLFMDTEKECFQWGRRKVTIYILE